MRNKTLFIGITFWLCKNSLVAQIAENKIDTDSIKIGSQVWLAQDLNLSHFRNGDSIPEVEDPQSWKEAGKKGMPAWCLYDDPGPSKRNYHKLYNWYVVNDQRGLAPVGWHIPSDSEWTVLTSFLGLLNEAGGKMKSTSGWAYNGNGSNESGFTGLPGGFRFDDGPFQEIGRLGFWWSASGMGTKAAVRYLSYVDNHVNTGWPEKGSGYFVRCIKN